MNIVEKIDKRKIKKPLISVIFSYYNNQITIKKSFKSILTQTFKNFEIIIISDGSDDKSNSIIKKLIQNKKNILFLRSKTNVGLTKSLNHCLRFARGKYIARHDADDYSHKKRFYFQIKTLSKNKNIHVLGTNAIHLQNDNKKLIKMPSDDFQIKLELPKKNSIIHSSVIILKKTLKKNKYNNHFRRCQDYELWLRIKNKVNFYNLQKNLVIRNANEANFTLSDLYYSCLARFKNLNLFQSFVYSFREIVYYILKKIFF